MIREIGYKYELNEEQAKTVANYDGVKNALLKKEIAGIVDDRGGIDFDKAYCEWPKPFGHSPYVKVHILYPDTVYTDVHEEVEEEINDVVKELFDAEIERKPQAEYH